MKKYKKVVEVEVDALADRKREIAILLSQHRQGLAVLADDDRRWLEREKRHYDDEAGDLQTWSAKRARIEKTITETAARVQERQAELDKQAADNKRSAETQQEALRRQYEQETDPYLNWLKSKSTRTF